MAPIDPWTRPPFPAMAHPVFLYECPGRLFYFESWAARLDATLRPFEDGHKAALESQRLKFYASPSLRR